MISPLELTRVMLPSLGVYSHAVQLVCAKLGKLMSAIIRPRIHRLNTFSNLPNLREQGSSPVAITLLLYIVHED
jgi:hypothetical protein